jgi:hypothetical protein
VVTPFSKNTKNANLVDNKDIGVCVVDVDTPHKSFPNADMRPLKKKMKKMKKKRNPTICLLNKSNTPSSM